LSTLKHRFDIEEVDMETENDRIEQLITLSGELLLFADSANEDISDDGCLCLYGLVKDCAYRIRTEAERERRVHAGRCHRAKGATKGRDHR
jgi:hypothetical protein